METVNHERIAIEVLITEREGMVAENKQREIEGKPLAYTEKDFWALGDRFYEIYRG